MNDYKMVQKTGGEVGKFKVEIVGDSGGRSYITHKDYFSKEEFEKYVLEGLRDLRKKASRRYELRTYDNQYDLPIPGIFNDGNCHTLISVKVEYLDEDGKVWTVEY